MAHTAKAHCAALDLFSQVINSSTQHHLAQIKTLDRRANQGNCKATKTRNQLVHLHALVQEHLSLADSVNAALETGHASAGALEKLRADMDRFTTDLQDFLRKAKVASKTIIKMISRVRSRAQTCNDDVCLRLMQLETKVEKLSHCSLAAGTTSGVLGSHGPIGADMSLGTAWSGVPRQCSRPVCCLVWS